jgi:hypothetical protein
MFRTLFLAFTLFSCPVFAQQVGFGVKGGVRATTDIEGSYGPSSESSWHVVGPMVEVTLPHGFSAEADALFSRFGYSSYAELGYAPRRTGGTNNLNVFLGQSEHGSDAEQQRELSLAVRGQSWSGGRRGNGSCDSRASDLTGNSLYALE